MESDIPNKTEARIKGGALATVGYLLSPLSFWNDAIINIPIAYALGALVGLVVPQFFLPSVVLFYWITNVIGFILLHKGTHLAVTGGPSVFSKKELLTNIALSFVYTLVIVGLIQFGLLKIPTEYFS